MTARPLLAISLLLAVPAFADSDAPVAAPAAGAAEAPAEPAEAPAEAEGTAQVDAALLGALQLPLLADAARDAGIPADEVAKALSSSRQHNLDAAGAADIFRRTMRNVREHGRIEAFGVFVDQQLEAGKRGQDLAAAIHEEHQRRGRFHQLATPPGQGSAEAGGPPGQGHEKGEHPGGKGDDGADASEHGRPEGAGKPEHEGAGKPEGVGKPDAKGVHEGKGGEAAEGRGEDR